MSTKKINHPGNPYKKQLGDLSMLWSRTGKAEKLYGIERWVLFALTAFLMLMPTMLVRWLGGRRSLHTRKIAIEAYALLKPLILVGLLSLGLWGSTVAVFVASLFLVDLYSYLLGIVLLRSFWVQPFSYTRSLILLGVNLFEFVAAFSVLYLYAGGLSQAGTVVSSWPDAFYFSAVTTTTVGYGDIVPLQGAGRSIATLQMFMSLGLLAIILAHFVGNIERERTPVR